MTVYTLKKELTVQEYFGWLKFYKMREGEKKKAANPNNIMNLTDDNEIVRRALGK